MKRSNSVKNAARIIKRGRSHDNILSAVANLLSANNTTEESIDSILHSIALLSSDNLNDSFIDMGEKISNLPDLKKQTVALEIERSWGKDIIKEGARKIA